MLKICVKLFYYLPLAFFINFNYSVAMSVTYNPKKKKRAKTHGFLVRSSSPTGKKVLTSRRRKGRAKIAVKTRKTKSK